LSLAVCQDLLTDPDLPIPKEHRKVEQLEKQIETLTASLQK